MVNFKQLKQEVGLEQVLSHYELLDHLEQKGKSLRGVCPFCEASVEQPFSVSLEKNAFQCFVCKASGNLFDFVARLEGIDISNGIRPAAAFVERTFLPKQEKQILRNIEVDHEDKRNDDQKGRTNPPLTFVLKGVDPTHLYGKELGISEETSSAFGAGFFSGKGMFKNHFVIPISNAGGELVAYNGIPAEGIRHSVYPPKFVKESELFNLKAVLADCDFQDSGLILVRDPLQVLVLSESGFARSIAFMGDVFSEEQLRRLFRTYGTGKKITYFCAREDEHTVDNLTRLLPLFFVRLVRYQRNDRSPAGFAVNELNNLLALR
jgi:DNA primase